jgi:hypothetical protein
MLMGIKGKLVEGQSMPLTLSFEKAGTVALELPVRGLGGGMAPGMDHGQHGQPDKTTN